jgi:hypothetical protein
MAQTGAFRAQRNGCTVTMAVGTVSAALQFDGFADGLGGVLRSGAVRLVNAGGEVIFLELDGQGGQAASPVGGIPLLPGQREVLATQGATHLVAVTAGGASTLYATPGDGGV